MAGFTWGAGGSRMTPEDIALQRAVLARRRAAGTDTSPVGHWTQGAARLFDAFGDVVQEKRLDSSADQNATENQSLISQLLGGSTASASPSVSPVASALTSGVNQELTATSPAPVVAEGEIADYIRQSASARGIDPEIALRVAMSEGGIKDPIRQSGIVKNGVREPSYGPFQLYMGGGLGNKALEAGIDPRDPNQWKQGVDFALDNAATGGWGPWYGAAKVGVGNRAGLDNARAIGYNPQSTPPAVAAIEQASPSSGYVDPAVSTPNYNPSVASALVDAPPMAAPVNVAPAPRVASVPSAPAQNVAPTNSLGVSPAVLQALTSPYANEQTKGIAQLLMQRQQGQADQQQKLALAEQQRQQELARRQAIAQQSGINPAYAQDDDIWKAATGNIFAAPSTSTLGNTIIDNRTGQPIYQGEPERQPLMNLGDGTVYDPNAPQDQRFIQAPNGGQKVPDSVRALEIRAERAGLQPGTPEYNQFMIGGGSGGTSLSVGADGSVQFNQGTGKNLTEAQGKDAFFSARMTSSMPTLDKYEQSLMSLPEAAAGALPAGRYLQSEEYQLAKDAGDDFVATYLRKDSGAALTKEERSEYGNMLLPQPGDKPAVVSAKRIRRQVAAQAIQLGLPQSAVDNMVKAVGEVDGAGSPVPTTAGSGPDATAAPSGVDPEDWKFLSPEERRLFQ